MTYAPPPTSGFREPPGVAARCGDPVPRDGARPSVQPPLPISHADFEAEFRRSYSSLWVIAAGIVLDRADADDVLQEAAIVAVRKLESFTPGSNFRAWMAQIVRNIALNFRRRDQRQSRRIGPRADVHTAEPRAPSAPERSPVAHDGTIRADQAALSDHVLKALRRLEPTVRACVLLRCIEGMAYSEISTVLDIPEGTAMSNVYRARAALAESLAPHSRVRG